MPSHDNRSDRDRISIFAIINPCTVYVALILWSLLRFLTA